MLLGQTSHVTAQTNESDRATNVIHQITQEEYLEMSDKRVDDFIAQQKKLVRHPTKAEEEWMAKVQRNFVPLQPWPEAFHKKETLQHSAAVFRAAIDMNEIELACGQLTNQPEAAVALKNLATAAMSSLDEFADILTSPELVTRGYFADLSNSKNQYSFYFWITNQLPTVVRSFEKFQPNGGLRIMDGDFYENGRLRVFSVNTVNSKGRLRGSGLSFKEDGKLEDYWFAPKETKP